MNQELIEKLRTIFGKHFLPHVFAHKRALGEYEETLSRIEKEFEIHRLEGIIEALEAFGGQILSKGRGEGKTFILTVLKAEFEDYQTQLKELKK